MFGLRFFSVIFVTYTYKMACNSAVVCPTRKCLPPSCSSRDSASDEIVCTMQSLKRAARACQMANNFRRAATLFYKDGIARVIHPNFIYRIKAYSMSYHVM